jgi:hypothetical protein
VGPDVFGRYAVIKRLRSRFWFLGRQRCREVLMRRAFLIGCLILVSFSSPATQSPVTGRWRAVLLIPDGGTQNISLELDSSGETVTGNIEGLAIRDGRLDGSTLTLKLSAPRNQADLPPGPIQFVARRDARAVGRSVSDPSVVQQLMTQFNVPGVSIAVIKDFKIVATYASSQGRSPGARAADRLQVFGWRSDDSTACRDGCRREAVRGGRSRMGPGSDRHDQQHLRAATGATSRETGCAWAQFHRRAHWRSVAHLPGAGRCRPVDHAGRPGQVRDRGAAVTTREVESRALADDRSRDGDAGWQCDLIAHLVHGYGAVIMTNGDGGGALIPRLRRLIEEEYKWDALDAPISRRYGPV